MPSSRSINPHEPNPHPVLRLGKAPAKVDARRFKLAAYLAPTLPPPPDAASWFSGITDWGMMANDMLGDCTIAAVAHAVQVWTAATGSPVTAADSVVVNYYSLWDGYVPGDPATDQGGVETDVLDKWRKDADGFHGYKLLAYADPDPGNRDHIKQSVALFGGVYIGLNLPISAQSQIGTVWTYMGGRPGTWGGHAVFVAGYDAEGLTCITWGKLQKMTWEFWSRYCDEAHTLLSDIWMNSAPADFHYANLYNDLQALDQ